MSKPLDQTYEHLDTESLLTGLKQHFSDCDIALTITLPKSLYRHPSRKQFALSKIKIISLFKGYLSKAFLVAELTKKGRIHLHCVVKLLNEHGYTDQTAFFQFIDHLKGYSICDLQVIKNQDRWFKYMLKEVQQTSRVIGRRAYYNYATNERFTIPTVAEREADELSAEDRAWLQTSIQELDEITKPKTEHQEQLTRLYQMIDESNVNIKVI